MENIVLASGNQGKVKEIQQLLSPLGRHDTPQTEWDFEEAEETGLTFVDNAIIDARHSCRHTGLPGVADDFGLPLTALGGAPGIYSDRSAGLPCSDRDNIAKLLRQNTASSEQERYASFHCVIVF